MKRKCIKKLFAIVLVFAMLAPVMDYLETNMSEVQAADEEEAVGYVIVPSSAVIITEPTNTTQPRVMSVKADDETYGQYADYIFAGWYTDEAATTAAASGTTGDYARFVPADILSTKVQVTNGIVTNSAIEKYNGNYVMRFVSSVDSVDYSYAGFELSYTDKVTNEVVTKTSKTYKAFKRIDSTTGATADNVDTYEFSPKVVDTKSEYFITGKWPVTEADKSVNYSVKAYWMTKDGTKVYGGERCVSVEDGTGTTAETRLNLTVDVELNPEYSYSVSYQNWSQETVTSSEVEVLTTGNGYSNIRIADADRDTRSVTEITITSSNDNSAYTETYRNLYSKYEDANGDKRADGTWYSADEAEYIIATRADMYGFAALVDASQQEGENKIQKYTFEGKKVYLVSDIELNPEELELIEGEHYLQWYTYDSENQKVYQDEPTHVWNPIGTSSYAFCGVFNGQGHTLSGLYLDSASGRFAGLFSKVANNAIVKDVKLKNSHLNTSTYDIGSIAAIMAGELNSVYSDAIVDCAGARSGGMVGQLAGTDSHMINCWFAGKITNNADATTARGTGGLVGAVTNGAKLTMTNCLNTGIVDVSTFTVQPYAGGLIGQVGQGNSGTLVLEDSCSTGELKHLASVTGGYGVVGCVLKGSDSTIKDTYGIKSACNRVISAVEGYSFLSNGMKLVDADIKGANAKTNMPNLGWDSTWSTVEHGIPVLTVFEKEVFDISWYDEDKSVYVLKDKGDLYGFAKLSATNNFAGKTIKLANDIIVNTGDAEDWVAGIVPYYTWTPIGTNGVNTSGQYIGNSFAGVFDGNLYTISGIYHVAEGRFSGLFAQTLDSTILQNFKLTNSYFNSTYADFGSITGYALGTYNNIYSDVIIKTSNEYVGGLVGRYAGTKSMNTCWYAGAISSTSTSKRFVGGLVGEVCMDKNLTLNSCLNTGTISSAYTSTNPQVGGLVGRALGTVNINNCLNAGLVQTQVEHYYGPITGNANSKATLTNTYAMTESARSHYKGGLGTDATSLAYTTIAEADMLGSKASENMSALGFYSESNTSGAWVTVDYRTPVLKVFKNERDGRIDVSWFDVDAYDTTNEYTLYDEEDLYGFTWLSKDYDFSGKTVKLGTDIVVNEGTASSTWATKSNYRQWLPVGSTGSNTAKAFLGTFDGQGYTISGLYINTTWRYAGLFASVGTSGSVQNLKLTNSYFKSTNREFGGIAGLGTGKFYNIYNNVIMNGNAATNGGFVGMSGGAVVMDKCWFEGTLINSYSNSAHQGTGAIIGYANSGTVTMTNCLNSGTVDMSSQTVNTTARLGGLMGYANVSVTMNACMNTKPVVASSTATTGYGPLVGYCANKTYVSISATYVLADTDIPNDSTLNEMNNLAQTTAYGVVTESDIKTNAATAMPLLNWSDDWKALSDAMPELQFDYATSVNGQKFVATSAEQSALANLYTGRTLFQGEMHNHAYTYGRGQDTDTEIKPGDDGADTLADWETQLTDLDMDFAASLDHQQTDHIDCDGWKLSKFVYGTEASATIIDREDQTSSGYLHFDMLFKTKEQFVSVLEKYSSQFDYTGNQRSDGTWFTYDNLKFTKAEFAGLIKEVYSVGGVVNIPHPLQGPDDESDYSTELTDFIFEVTDDAGKQVIYGFHAITSGYTAGNSKVNYQAWENLLNQGYRIYATSGSDNHAGLHANTLTSIYATTCTIGCDGSCNDTNCAAYDKGNMLSQISCGDYVAGSVGIQMSIGDTAMGGSRTLVDEDRLIIGVGDIHNGYENASTSHTLRIDVMNEDGVVYSQKVATGDTIALNVDTSSDYYRVVIYNVNTSARIAIGNPIWNDK